MELRDYLNTLRRRWMIVLATLAVCVLAAVGLTAVATPMYSSDARLFVSTSQTGSTSELAQGGQFSVQRVQSYADLVRSRDLATEVLTDTGVELTPNELIERVSATVVPETVNLELRVVDPEPRQAQALTQAYAEGMTELVRQLETPSGETTSPIKVTVVDAASEPDAPVSPQPVRNVGLGLVLGLLLGVGLAALRDVLDTTIKRAEDLEHTTAAPLLGTISFDGSAKGRPLITELDSHAPRVEAFRVLRTNMQFVDVDAVEKVFVVTSSLPSEGKTTTSINLAITLAQAGQRTLLIEADLRRPKAAVALDLDNAVGVTTVLVGKVSLTDAIQKHGETDLHVLASGAVPPNPAELLQSKAMSELLAEIRQQYDVVIIDAPPLLPVTDAALLAAQADGALLIARHGKTTKDQFAQAINRLEQVDARPVGVVLNMVPTGRRAGGYGYGYGYAPESGAS